METVDHVFRAKRRSMQKLARLFVIVLLLLGVGTAVVDARGGRSSADCPPGSKDPDCQ